MTAWRHSTPALGALFPLHTGQLGVRCWIGHDQALFAFLLHLKRVQNALDTLAFTAQVVLIPAYGPHTRPDNWFQSCIGTKIILNELEKLTDDPELAAACGQKADMARVLPKAAALLTPG